MRESALCLQVFVSLRLSQNLRKPHTLSNTPSPEASGSEGYAHWTSENSERRARSAGERQSKQGRGQGSGPFLAHREARLPASDQREGGHASSQSGACTAHFTHSLSCPQNSPEAPVQQPHRTTHSLTHSLIHSLMHSFIPYPPPQRERDSPRYSQDVGDDADAPGRQSWSQPAARRSHPDPLKGCGARAGEGERLGKPGQGQAGAGLSPRGHQGPATAACPSSNWPGVGTEQADILAGQLCQCTHSGGTPGPGVVPDGPANSP